MAMAGPWAMTPDTAPVAAMASVDLTVDEAVPPMPMTEAAARLLLIQLLSPAFPVGGFAYSQGLESAMVAGQVRDAATLTDWIHGVLNYGSGRMDAILLAHARKPGADLHILADLATAYAPGAERAMEMRDQRMSFAQVACALGYGLPALPYALAFGAVSADVPLQVTEIALIFLKAVTTQLTSAAGRLARPRDHCPLCPADHPTGRNLRACPAVSPCQRHPWR